MLAVAAETLSLQAKIHEATAQPDDLVLRSYISEWMSLFCVLPDPVPSQQ